MTVEERRKKVVDEAISWIGTPYRTNARVKGKDGGVDCLTFLADVFANAGEIERLPIPRYPHDFHLHSKEEYYLNGKDETPGILSFCDEVEDVNPLPGDVYLFKFGHSFSHSAIVVDYPVIIHAWLRRPVSRDDVNRRTVLNRVHEVIELRNTPRPRKLLRLKSWRTP